MECGSFLYLRCHYIVFLFYLHKVKRDCTMTTYVMNDSEFPIPPEDQIGEMPGDDPVLPPVEGEALANDPFIVGTSVVDPDGRVFTIIPSDDPAAVRMQSIGDGPEEVLEKSRIALEGDLRGSQAEWNFKEPTADQMIWSSPEAQQYLVEHPEQEAEIKNNLLTLTNRTNTDVESILTAGKALKLPGVALVDMLRRNGFSDEVVKQVKERFMGADESEAENETPDQKAMLDELQAMLKENETDKIKDVVSNKLKFNDLSDDEQKEFRTKMASLRMALNNFRETKTYGGIKISLKVLLCLIAAALYLQMMTLAAHAGAGKGR